MLSGSGGVEVDADSAVALLEELLKDNQLEAMWMLGLCYEYGLGTEQDIDRAKQLYTQIDEESCDDENALLIKSFKKNDCCSGILEIEGLQQKQNKQLNNNIQLNHYFVTN